MSVSSSSMGVKRLPTPGKVELPGDAGRSSECRGPHSVCDVFDSIPGSMKIGVDIDGVIADILTPLAARINKEFGHDIGLKDLDKFDLSDTLKKYDIKSTWLFKMFKDEWFWSEAIPYEENIQTLNEWKAQGHMIYLLTGRSSSTGIQTAAWLRRAKVSYSRLEFLKVMKKYEFMLKEEIPVIFEDRFFEANKTASYGMRSFVIRRSYNTEYEGRSFNSLLTYVDSLADGQTFINRYEEFVT